ncbi:hypothetical protein ACR9GP_24565 [Enterobacter ludwigii]
MEEKQTLAEKSLALIRYVNTWKKVFILIVLVSFFGLGYFVWEGRRELAFWAMESFGHPVINESTVDMELKDAMADTGAKTTALWSINLDANQRSAMYVRVGSERMGNLEGVTDLALRPHSELSTAIIHLIDNKTGCWDHIANTAVGTSARAAGVEYVCAASVPPRYGVMIGMLVLGFEKRPENEDYVKMRILQAAERIIR